jgi:hypothetical protein
MEANVRPPASLRLSLAFPVADYPPCPSLSLKGWGADSIRSGVSKYSSTTCSMRCADVRPPSARSLLISLSLLWLTSTCHYNLRLPTSPAVERTSSTSTRRSRRSLDKSVLPFGVFLQVFRRARHSLVSPPPTQVQDVVIQSTSFPSPSILFRPLVPSPFVVGEAWFSSSSFLLLPSVLLTIKAVSQRCQSNSVLQFSDLASRAMPTKRGKKKGCSSFVK